MAGKIFTPEEEAWIYDKIREHVPRYVLAEYFGVDYKTICRAVDRYKGSTIPIVYKKFTANGWED